MAEQAEPKAEIEQVEQLDVENKPGRQVLNVDVDMNRLRISTVVLATLAVIAVVVFSYFIYRSLFLILLFFLALLVATAIEPLVNVLRKGPFSRTAGILIVYTGLFAVVGVIGYILVSVFFSQLGSFATSTRDALADLRQSAEQMESGFVRQQALLFLNVAEGAVNEIVAPPPSPDQIPEQEKEATVANTATFVAEFFFAVSTIFVVAFYWLNERTLIKRWVMSWFPPRRANRIRRVWDDIEVKVGGWVRGQLVLMLIVAVSSAIGYFIIGVNYWPALALFAGLAEAIPLIGPYIGTAPAVLVALTQPDGLPKALAVVIFAVILQTVEGNILIPRVMKNTVGISPLSVIVSILLGATLAGLVGALVAVPLAGAVQVVVSDLKAARQGQEKFEENTEEARQTRAEDGELVVAYPAKGDTQTKVESGAASEA